MNDARKYTFWDVEGIPVWVRPDGVAEAFDTTPVRRFPCAAILQHGVAISASEFMDLARSQTYGRDPSIKFSRSQAIGQEFVDNLNRNVLFEDAGLIPSPS